MVYGAGRHVLKMEKWDVAATGVDMSETISTAEKIMEDGHTKVVRRATLVRRVCDAEQLHMNFLEPFVWKARFLAWV